MNAIRNIEAVLFDFDGTLAPNLDLPDMRRQVVDLTVSAGVPAHVFENLYIVEIIEASHHWLSQRDFQQATLYKNRANQRIVDIELNAAAETRLFAGVKDMLVGLRDNNIKLGIVTRNCRAAIDQVFPDHPQYVDALHARDDVNYLKPNPQHLQDNLTALGAQAARSVMVGDGALDMQAGRELNMHCIGVLTGSNNSIALQQAGASQVLENCLTLHKSLV
jgi:phosphoglycolate phosphatase